MLFQTKFFQPCLISNNWLYYQMFSIVAISHTCYVMAGGDSSQPYLPLYETNLSTCKITTQQCGTSYFIFSIFRYSDPISRDIHDILLCGVHHLLGTARPRCEKGVPRPLLPMDDHDAPPVSVHGRLRFMAAHRLLHRKHNQSNVPESRLTSIL